MNEVVHRQFAGLRLLNGFAAGDARQLVARLLAWAMAALRCGQLLLWPAVVLPGTPTGLRSVGLAVAVYAVQAGWTFIWLGIVIGGRQIPRWSPAADVVVFGTALILAGRACVPEDAASWANSAATPAIGAAATAAIVWPVWLAAVAVAVLLAAYLAGAAPAFAYTPATVATTAAVLLIAAISAGWAARLLAALARERDESRAAVRILEARLTDAQHRSHEWSQQLRTLHDTVLSTLSALARGGLDPGSQEVRERCAADADYLRSILMTSSDGGSHLQRELAKISRAQAAMGVRIHLQCAELPAGLPPHVADAIAGATREALNNVVKHAESAAAWVTALSLPGGGVSVTITDQGKGFDPATVADGLGLSQSVRARMRDISGGSATVDSHPGEGTVVELNWSQA